MQIDCRAVGSPRNAAEMEAERAEGKKEET